MAAKRKPAGSIRITKKGYVFIKVENDPLFGTGYCKRSHFVLCHKIGRKLTKGEIVHHINGNKSDDRPENLEVMRKNEHDSYHRKIGTPWNKGKKGVYSAEHLKKLAEANSKRVWKESSKKAISEFAKNRTDLKRNEDGRFYYES